MFCNNTLPVVKRSLDQFLLHPEILKAVLELGVGHVYGELLKDVRLLGIEVESQVFEPLEIFVVVNLV